MAYGTTELWDALMAARDLGRQLKEAEPEAKSVLLVDEPGKACVDSGCGRGIIGEETLAMHQERLRGIGLETVE